MIRTAHLPQLTRDTASLPFDQYQRYRLVTDLLEELRLGDEPHTVLDVGGRTGILRRFLPSDQVTLVDVEPSTEAGLVLGNGGALPFRDGAFDVVASFDTLEHVPAESREAFVRECTRVARRWVILAGPYDSARNNQAEDLLRRFCREKLGFAHRYLEEHTQHGLPDRAWVEARLADAGCRVESFGHGNIERWLALLLLSMYLQDDPALRGLDASLHRFYNEHLFASDYDGPVYRHFVVGALNGAPLPHSPASIAGRTNPSAGAGLGPWLDLAFELGAFDRERRDWRKEREELGCVLADLSEDLEGHHKTLAALRIEHGAALAQALELRGVVERERVQSAAVIDELRMELDAARAEIANLEDELERERGEGRKVVRALEEDLAGFRAKCEALEGVLQTERAGRAATVSALEADVREHASVLADTRENLARHVALLATLQEELEAQVAETATLRELIESERAQSASSIATLEQDLAGHREQTSELEEDLAEHARSLAALSAERDKVAREAADERGTLLADLAEHERVLAEAREDLEEHRRTIAALEATLRDERAGREDVLSELQSERAAFAAVRAALEQDLAEHRKSLEDLRHLLRGRLKNLKRAFGPKPKL